MSISASQGRIVSHIFLCRSRERGETGRLIEDVAVGTQGHGTTTPLPDSICPAAGGVGSFVSG